MNDPMQFISATTTERSLDSAIDSLLRQVHSPRDTSHFDLAFVFLSAHFSPIAPFITDRLRDALKPRVLIGCTCEGVIGKEHELENRPAITLIAARMPHVTLHPFALDRDDWDTLEDESRFCELVAAPPETRLFLMIGDPYSAPTDRLLEAFNTCFAGIPIVGGMASGAAYSGGNTLILNDRAFNAGAVGVALAGNFDFDVIVSQGCRPFGRTFTVTEVDGNVITQLDGEPPVPLIEDLIEQLSDEDRQLLKNGLFVGRAVRSDKSILGRGDFLIRTFMGADRESGAIAVGDFIHTGEIIQFHLRDQVTATEDLELLLFPQTLYTPPSGGLLFSCNGRGTRLYDHPNGDISTIQAMLGGVDIAGFFCAGELGPIGGKNFLHGHTASLVLFRPRSEHPND
jgi:small ligand-binding sensory domain FIST